MHRFLSYINKKSVKLVKLRVDFTGLMGSVTFLEKRLGIYMVDGN